ncbi:MAG: alpha-glucosidase [Anaerolineales bacterium]|nr:alpha-glucosidase [Anaerolineales bacterium]
MRDFWKVLNVLRFIGLRQFSRFVRYAVLRDIYNRRWGERVPSTQGAGPNNVHGHVVSRSGARFQFREMGLDIHFLTPDFVRITWTPGSLPVGYALEETEWPQVDIEVQDTKSRTILSSSEMDIVLSEDGSLTYRAGTGQSLRREAPPQRVGEAWIQQIDLKPEAQIFGLGERAGSLNVRGRSYRLWNSDAGGSYGPGSDPLYLTIPVYVCLQEEGSSLIFYENSFDGSVSMNDRLTARFEGGVLRYYIAFGALEHLFERYTALTGRPPLPPRWALGYHQSRWGYKTEADVLDVVEGFAKHDLPLSAIHLDIDYMDGYRIFSVDQNRFPDLTRLASELREKGIRLVTIIDPGVKVDSEYEVYKEGIAGDHFCKLPDGSVLQAPVWPGWCAFPDFTSSKARAWWGSQYARLLDQGICGIWHDMNEPTTFTAWGEMTFPEVTQHDLEGVRSDHRQAHNLYGLLMNQAGFEALRMLRPDHRPWLVSRSGWAGLQRYAWNWTGDTESTWRALRMTVATVLNLGFSGIPYTGPDIGGFSHHPDAELYTRWFQLATFLPFFRTHSAWDTSRREPWVFGEPTLSIVRHFLELRYRLMPYLYTLAWEANKFGLPLVRPLFWSQEADSDLWSIDDAFMLGEKLLVAPVLEEGVQSRKLRLPQGHWYDFWDGTLVQGGSEVDLDAPLTRVPILVAAGCVLPMEVEDRLILHLYPPIEGDAESRLFNDAGDGYGTWRVDRFETVMEEGNLRITRSSEGDYPFPYTEVELVLHGIFCRRAWVDGRETAVRDNRFVVVNFKMVELEIEGA